MKNWHQIHASLNCNIKNLVTFTEPRFIYGDIWYNDGSIFLSLYAIQSSKTTKNGHSITT